MPAACDFNYKKEVWLLCVIAFPQVHRQGQGQGTRQIATGKKRTTHNGSIQTPPRPLCGQVPCFLQRPSSPLLYASPGGTPNPDLALGPVL